MALDHAPGGSRVESPGGVGTQQEGAGHRVLRRVGADLREVVVIALGILCAFAIDAWWAELEEDREVRKALLAVMAEARVNLDRMESTSAAHRRVADAGLDLLHLTGPDAGPEHAGRAYELLGEFWMVYGSDVTTGSLETLIASGNLARIDNTELQQALLSWLNGLQWDVTSESELRAFLQTEIRPRLWRHVPQLAIELESGFKFNQLLRTEFLAGAPEHSRFAADFPSLLRDMEFESAVVQRTSLSLIASQVLQWRMREGRQLLDLLASEGI